MAPHPAAALAELCAALGHDVAGVLAMRNARRPENVDELRARVPVEVAVAGSKDELAPLLARWRPDLAICNGFGWRIPPAALTVPRHGIINSHPSRLPRWRGPNPFAWTLRANDPELGVTFHRMDEDFDTGAILAQGGTPLTGTESVESLLALMPPLVASLLARALERVEAGDPGDPQPEEGATYAPLFEDEYAEIDWSRNARDVFDQCRCWFQPTVSGIMGPLTTLDGRRVRVLEASLDLDGDGVVVPCADRPLRVVRTESA
jgi:methionyl-tRNA formyltransferase